MRIALIHYSCLPVIGGVEFILAAHARLFADHGHEVTVICRGGTSDDPRIRFEPLAETDEAARAFVRWVHGTDHFVIPVIDGKDYG